MTTYIMLEDAVRIVRDYAEPRYVQRALDELSSLAPVVEWHAPTCRSISAFPGLNRECTCAPVVEEPGAIQAILDGGERFDSTGRYAAARHELHTLRDIVDGQTEIARIYAESLASIRTALGCRRRTRTRW